MKRALVIGAGVVGMTTALQLQSAGYLVEIWSRDQPEFTHSAVAAAFWYPYLVNHGDASLQWAKVSYDVFTSLSSCNTAGIIMRRGHVILRNVSEVPPWSRLVTGFDAAWHEVDGLSSVMNCAFDMPVIDMPRYLVYLRNRFEENGGLLVRRCVESLRKECKGERVVINCTGLGARVLADDTELYAVRGQVLRVEPMPSTEVVFDPDHPSGVLYIVPRTTDAILGGTAEVGCESTMPDAATSDDILQRCRDACGGVRATNVVEALVGLRPCRKAVRLEAEVCEDGGVIVHNYGHGGAGVTLSCGCAVEVVRMLHDICYW